ITTKDSRKKKLLRRMKLPSSNGIRPSWRFLMTLSRRYGSLSRSTGRRLNTQSKQAAPNKALQTDKGKLSCLLHAQKPRQLAFAAELNRYTSSAHRGGRR